ncbi:M50 family metallopeptidase [Microaerobacter geothermalis]|uniref:M50 family metallopeptidase n=1 Tax=Microaerobacter geothermalis TaxID=674972 RepID=UPI001F2B7AF0|nr:M50 family metallopeptidase [Microaerobacter geothermalis]MCF6092714.1 M50 family metallopeptidase [Microaerobacter geothermalis]
MKVTVHPLFWVVIGFALLFGRFLEIISLFTIVVIHELGHVYTAKAFGWRVTEISLLPFGGVAKVDELGNTLIREECMVALAGPFINGLMMALSVLMYRLGWWNREWADFFFIGNAYIALFNLLPIWPLDGSKVLKALISYACPYRKVIRLIIWVSSFGILFLLWTSVSQPDKHLNVLFINFFLAYSTFIFYRHREYHFFRFLIAKYDAIQLAKESWPVKFIYIKGNEPVKDLLKRLFREKYHLFSQMDEKKKNKEFIGEEVLLNAYFNR